MTHPAVYAITLGVALGAALFAFFATAKFRQENPHGYNNDSERRYRRSESESWGSRTKSGKDICTICLESIDKGQSMRLHCEHEFHRRCIAELKKSSNLCPNCRREFSF